MGHLRYFTKLKKRELHLATLCAENRPNSRVSSIGRVEKSMADREQDEPEAPYQERESIALSGIKKRPGREVDGKT